MIMLKDNHIDYCGSIEEAILRAHDYVVRYHPHLKIEVETRSLNDVKKVLSGDVNLALDTTQLELPQEEFSND